MKTGLYPTLVIDKQAAYDLGLPLKIQVNGVLRLNPWFSVTHILGQQSYFELEIDGHVRSG